MFDRFNQTIFQLWDDIVRYINGNMFQWEIFTLFKKRMSMWWHYYSSADYLMNTSLPIPEITMKFHNICQHILYYLKKHTFLGFRGNHLEKFVFDRMYALHTLLLYMVYLGWHSILHCRYLSFNIIKYTGFKLTQVFTFWL